MSSSPSIPDNTGGRPSQGERRHANRVQIEGYVFDTGTASYPVLDLSIGGMRLACPADQPAPQQGASLAGTLSGGTTNSITLTAQVLWVDGEAGHIGCTFPVLGRHIAGDLLEILL